MALIIEDGTGVANASSYATAAELVTYAAARGLTLTEAAAEPLLIEAMERLTGLDYLGDRLERDQALDWPRADVCIEGFEYDSDELPAQLKQAQLAYAFAANSMELMPAAATDARGQVIEKTIGPLTTRYAERHASTTRASVPVADALLAKLLRAGSANSFRIVRA